MKKINKIAITGGTHGNELTGVYIINKFLKNTNLVKRDSFKTIFFHTNKKAIEKCTRYIDKDLNRCFRKKDLKNPNLNSYEEKLAKEINDKLNGVDFIVDLHSTTSDMGLSIVVDTEDKLTWEIIAYLKQNIKELKVFRWKGDEEDVAFLNSISKSGFAIEVGPIPQGVITADMFFGTELIIQKILDFFELYNTKNLPIYSKDIEIYDHIKLVDYPRDENNNILAMVHSSLQGKGYVKLEKNSPLFITFDGKTINYEENEEVYALFINEAAYYEKGFAMCLTNKITVSIKDNMA